MKFWLCLGVWATLALAAYGDELPGKEATARSASGQFIVHALHTELSHSTGPRGTVVSQGPVGLHMLSMQAERQHPDENPIRLDAPLVALACERVKQAFLRELHLEDRWTGEIDIYIQPLIKVEQISVSALPLRDHWLFRVIIPREMREVELDRLILHVILQERTTRRSVEMLNNVPHWLTEGLAAYLRASSADYLSVQRIAVAETHPLQRVALRDHFTGSQPLSFEEMSWPDSLAGDRQAEFVPSAQLFVGELLSVKGGPAAMGRMLDLSWKYRNWQFAFLEAFADRFGSAVEVEKWWSLTWISLLGVNKNQMWTTETAWQKLNDSLKAAVMVQSNRTDQAVRRLLTLQDGIRDVPKDQQDDLFGQVLVQLRLLRVHSPPGPAALAEAYDEALTSYLTMEARAGLPARDKMHPGVNVVVLKRETCARLDQLDKQRLKLQADMRALTGQVSTNR